MKKIIEDIVLCCTMLLLPSAEAMAQYHTPRSGDVLSVEECTFQMDSTTGDSSRVWSVSDITFGKRKSKFHYWNEADTVMSSSLSCLFHGQKFQYSESSDGLWLKGARNHTANYRYLAPVLVVPKDFHSDVHYQGNFVCIGNFTNGRDLEECGTWTNEIGKPGKLVIDDGDTIKDVLMQRIFARVSIKDADLKGVTDSVLLAKWNDKNIIAALASDDKKVCFETLRWYASGYRYPILEEKKVINDQGKAILTRAYYISPSEQNLLVDNDNEEIRSASSGASGTNIGGRNGSESKYYVEGDGYALKASNDGQLVFSYRVNGKTNERNSKSKVYCGVWSLAGINVCRSKQCERKPGLWSETFSLQTQPHGVYLLQYAIDDKKSSVKFEW